MTKLIRDLEKNHARLIERAWKQEIQQVLQRTGPIKTAELIINLGFDCEATLLDKNTRVVAGLKPLHGSFLDSDAQRVLGNMVAAGEVHWQRSANCDNWYALPGQQFPSEAAPRSRSLKQLATEVFEALPEHVRNAMQASGNMTFTERIESIEKEDVWMELYPFVLSLHEDGWELADGDPVCNWCFNTFTERYPLAVDAAKIARKMVRVWQTTWKSGKRLSDDSDT